MDEAREWAEHFFDAWVWDGLGVDLGVDAFEPALQLGFGDAGWEVWLV